MVPPRLARLPRRELPDGLRVFEAGSLLARALGLAWLDELPPACALLLRRCRSVHTFGMRFPLALIFLDSGDRLIEVRPSVAPGRVASCRSAGGVLECGPDEAERFTLAWEAARERRPGVSDRPAPAA